MKILHLVPTLSAGGAETFVAHLAVEQKALGHDVDVFLLAGVRGARGETLRAELGSAAVRCFGTAPRSARAPLNVARLFQRIMVGRYDVVHAHLFSIEVVLASLIPVLTFFRAKPLLVRTLHNSNIFGTRSHFLAKLLARSFDWNFACGRKVMGNYVKLFGKSRTSAIDNGVKTSFNLLDKNASTIRHQLGVPADAFVVSCTGAFRGATLETSQKAQDVALRAFHLAFGNDLTAHLLFAGDGELRHDAEALARELGLTRNVHFLGNIPNIYPLFKGTDLLFVPSRYEGLPMVGLEAGCAGVPVLASAIDELMDVGAPHGWVFSSNNSVEDFARKLAALREESMVVRSRAREMSGLFRMRYGINRCAQEYLMKIQELLEHPHRPLGPTVRHKKRSTDA